MSSYSLSSSSSSIEILTSTLASIKSEPGGQLSAEPFVPVRRCRSAEGLLGGGGEDGCSGGSELLLDERVAMVGLSSITGMILKGMLLAEGFGVGELWHANGEEEEEEPIDGARITVVQSLKEDVTCTGAIVNAAMLHVGHVVG